MEALCCHAHIARKGGVVSGVHHLCKGPCASQGMIAMLISPIHLQKYKHVCLPGDEIIVSSLKGSLGPKSP